ncbi:hypothetical protein SOVF_215000 [Spinacia oleracea]|nr:hypothetical protein SOVF_215000 [Spinacia oleracea]
MLLIKRVARKQPAEQLVCCRWFCCMVGLKGLIADGVAASVSLVQLLLVCWVSCVSFWSVGFLVAALYVQDVCAVAAWCVPQLQLVLFLFVLFSVAVCAP